MQRVQRAHQRRLSVLGSLGVLGCLLMPGALQAQEQTTRNVAIVIWDNAEVLDWAGPSEVFVAATFQGAVQGHRPFNVYTVSKTRDPIVSQTFIDVIPDYAIDEAPAPDIVVLPGGGTSSVLQDEEFLAWAQRVSRDAEIALSVCTGAFILGSAGLLDDKDVTTWYGATEGLARQFPKARVHEGRRFIDNGQVVTTAGVSAGIDGALHVVARLLGRDVADRTAQYMEYRWAPQSFLSKDYAWLNPNTDAYGRDLQRASVYQRGGDNEAALSLYRQLASQQPDNTQTRYALGRACYRAEEWMAAAEAFVAASADEDGRRWALYNAACSAARGAAVDQALGYLERSVAAGFDDVERLQSDDDLASLRDEPRFAAVRDQAAARAQEAQASR